MIIPVKCFTCGKVIGNKYTFYLKEVRKAKSTSDDFSKVTYLLITPAFSSFFIRSYTAVTDMSSLDANSLLVCFASF